MNCNVKSNGHIPIEVLTSVMLAARKAAAPFYGVPITDMMKSALQRAIDSEVEKVYPQLRARLLDVSENEFNVSVSQR